jgi:hypothetical protein
VNIKDKLNSNGNKLWFVVVLLNIATFTSGYAIGAYKSLGEIEKQLSEIRVSVARSETNVSNLTQRIDDHISLSSMSERK